MSRVERPVDFVGRLEQSIGRAVVGGKAISYAHLLVNFVASRKRIPRSRLAGAVVALAGVESAAGIVRTLRKGRVIDPVVGWVDTVTAAAAIVGEAVTWGTRAFPPDPRLGLPHAVTVSVFLPAMLPDRDVLLRALAIPTATFVAASNSRAVADPSARKRALRVSEATVMPLSAVFSHRLVLELRRLAVERDQAESAAVLAATRLAAERERERQYRSIHDSPLQFLEAVGGGWDLDDKVLLERIDDEILALELIEVDDLRHSDDLAIGVRRLGERFGDRGLAVELDLPEVSPTWRMGPEVVDALLGGMHEALVNVLKHAGTTTARVSVRIDAERLTVVVLDRGVGFDPGERGSGFGIERSIVGRMKEIDGGGMVESVPGQGTEVTLWVTNASPSS